MPRNKPRPPGSADRRRRSDSLAIPPGESPGPPIATAAPTTTSGLASLCAGWLVIGLCTVTAYLSSFRGGFLLDDISEIVANPAMGMPFRPWEAMFVGHVLPARPLPYLTFALHHTVDGTNAFDYHLVNLIIHGMAAFAVAALATVAFRSPRMATRWGPRGCWLATIIATTWAVHPLNTQAVTYIYQRIESLAGMLMLVSLACFAVATRSGWSPRWAAACIACAAAAMASKETAVVLPLLIAIYDWTFVAETTNDLWQRRRFYLYLAATWAVLVAVLIGNGRAYQEFDTPRTGVLSYALTQPSVIMHYLRLACWPVGQCIDYDWPVASPSVRTLASVLTVAGAVIVTVRGLWQRRPWAAPAALFFLGLAPTSSAFPVAALVNEHRMYMPLVGVISLAVCGATMICDRMGAGLILRAGLTAVVVGGLMILTDARNRLYESPFALWQDTLRQNPTNPRVNAALAGLTLGNGDLDGAIRYADAAQRADFESGAYNGLLQQLLAAGDLVGGERVARHAVAMKTSAGGPDRAATLEVTADLITLLHSLRSPEAVTTARRSIDAMRLVLGANHPATISTTTLLAADEIKQGRPAAGEALARQALAQINAQASASHLQLGATEVLAAALGAQGRPAEAKLVLRRAIDDLNHRYAKDRPDVSPLQAALARLPDAPDMTGGVTPPPGEHSP